MIDVLDRDTRAHAPAHAAKQPQGRHTAVVVLLPLRLFLAVGWLRAAAEKLIEAEWWNGNQLRGFLTEQHDEALPFFRPIMQDVLAPNAQAVAIVVVLTQLACGVAIAIGKPLRLSLRWVFLLNVVFIMAGRVNPSAFYLIMEVVLLFAIADGTIGVRPTSPSWRTVVIAGFVAGLAGAVAPYVRTIEPANLIDDPAMMLVFVGLIIAVTLMVRRSAYRPQELNYIRGLWKTWAAGWMHAKPRNDVRRENDWRLGLRHMALASPPHGPAISTLPPSGEPSSTRGHLRPQPVGSVHGFRERELMPPDVHAFVDRERPRL